jgi:hypothetical protein
MEIINTSCAKITIQNDGLSYIEYLKGAKITVVQQEENLEQFLLRKKDLSGLYIHDFSNMLSFTPKARKFVLDSRVNEITRAVAILVYSPLSKLLANILIKKTKPLFPLQVFTDRTKAELWLKSI